LLCSYTDAEGYGGEEEGEGGAGGMGSSMGFPLEPGIPVPEVPYVQGPEEGKKALNRCVLVGCLRGWG